MRTNLTNIQKKRYLTALKWAIYIVMIFACVVIMTTGNTTRPLLLISLPICIAIREHEMVAGPVGAICGLLIDICCFKTLGFNAILVMCFCVITSLLFTHLLRQNFVNILWITALSTFIQGGLDYFFFYGMWGTSDSSLIFKEITVPSMIYTVISVGAFYPLVKLIYAKTNPKIKLKIEE